MCQKHNVKVIIQKHNVKNRCLTCTIRETIARKSIITVTIKRTLAISTVGIFMAWAIQAFINVYRLEI